ncbi:WecB/TagA/CpsF family glycosyltransferase [Streptomyces sp. NPDC001941]|uniref:WecB/TagA/CpsF family glycosyltransferase n=1 Tax=Streptomyces sp. NPDC001941 TaxID=3154659 RepID=UPI003331868A
MSGVGGVGGGTAVDGAEHPRVDVLGTRISAVDPARAVAEVARWIHEHERSYVCVTGVHGVMESVRDPELRAIHNASGLTVPDGMPMVWAAHRAGVPAARRVYGPDLMLAVLARAAEEGWSSYYYGGAPGVPEELARRMEERFPGAKTAGAYSPPYRPLTAVETYEVRERINLSGADLVWVGLSTPKQERWMAEHRAALAAPVLLGVGAAFDFHTGRVSQAPEVLQRNGLEWAYRLHREPRRLWRRYLRNNPEYLARLAVRPPRLVREP